MTFGNDRKMKTYVLLIAMIEHLYDKVADTTHDEDVHIFRKLWEAGDARITGYEFSVPEGLDRRDAELLGLGRAFKDSWVVDDSIYVLLELNDD